MPVLQLSMNGTIGIARIGQSLDVNGSGSGQWALARSVEDERVQHTQGECVRRIRAACKLSGLWNSKRRFRLLSNTRIYFHSTLSKTFYFAGKSIIRVLPLGVGACINT